MWNLCFRTTVNQTQSFQLSHKSLSNLTADDAEHGAKQILELLCGGVYRDSEGKFQKVSGDMTKVWRCEGLTPAARKLLAAVEHTSRRVEGTQEVRRLMRWNLWSWGVVYGQSIFVTFSPSEKHSLLMIRLARVRGCDSAMHAADETQTWLGIDAPSIEHDFVDTDLPIPPQCRRCPQYEVRRRITARDPLCCSDGFRVLCRLVLRHIFGVRTCPYCPYCGAEEFKGPSCQDRLGCSSSAVGGVFGRVEVVFGSVENQKAGSLHLHAQLFVQCLHQHVPLYEVLSRLRNLHETPL